MRKADVAETLLSLVGSAERARSFVGDLMEEQRTRTCLVLAIGDAALARDARTGSPVGAVSRWRSSCVVAWFLYMLLSAVLALAGYVAVTLAWGIAYVLNNHTGLELFTDLLRIRFNWPPIPDAATYLIQAVVLFVIAPFQLGRSSARFWRGHEVSLAVMMLVVWTGMAAFVPLVGVGITARPAMVPVMVMFVLAGALLERFRSTPAALS